MVTWGANTIHTISSNPPSVAAPSFSFAAPPSLSAPSLWNTTGTAPPSFLSTNTSAPSSFFTTATPTAPAQAAYQAHQDAAARNETARVLQKLQSLFDTYNGTTVVEADRPSSHCFSTILYVPSAAPPSIAATDLLSHPPPRPPSINQADWNVALLRCSSSERGGERMQPVVRVGADALQARVGQQQEHAALLDRQMAKVREALSHWQERQAQVQALIEYRRRQGAQLRLRLVKLMRNVEVLRGQGVPLQTAELEAFARLRQLQRHVEEDVVPVLLAQPTTASTTTMVTHHHHPPSTTPTLPTYEQQQAWKPLLAEHRAAIAELTRALAPLVRDVSLLRDRVLEADAKTVPGVFTISSSRNNEALVRTHRAQPPFHII